MKCISCNNDIFKKYADDSNLSLPVFCCKECGLLITGNSESEIVQKIKDLYKKKYWDSQNSEFSIDSEYSDIWHRGKKRDFLSQFAYCKPYLQNKKTVLEIGAGTGATTFWLENKGYDITGIEPDARNVELINKKLKTGKIIQGFIEDLDVSGKYQIIWMSHVLEHLVRPDTFLTKIKNNLDENGIFFIEVPNSEHKPTLFASINENPHVYHFSKKSLTNIVEKAGYTVISCDYFRPASIFEGGIKKILKNHTKKYPYYPRILTDNKLGRDLRILLKKEKKK